MSQLCRSCSKNTVSPVFQILHGSNGVLEFYPAALVSLTSILQSLHPQNFLYLLLKEVSLTGFSCVGLSTRFNVTFSKRLINGPPGFLGSNSSAPTFLTLVGRGNFTLIQAIYGLQQADALNFAGYLNYIITKFVDTFITGVVCF